MHDNFGEVAVVPVGVDIAVDVETAAYCNKVAFLETSCEVFSLFAPNFDRDKVGYGLIVFFIAAVDGDCAF